METIVRTSEEEIAWEPSRLAPEKHIRTPRASVSTGS
jgi:hypothetical protein